MFLCFRNITSLIKYVYAMIYTAQIEGYVFHEPRYKKEQNMPTAMTGMIWGGTSCGPGRRSGGRGTRGRPHA